MYTPETTTATPRKQYVVGNEDNQTLITIWEKAPSLSRCDEDNGLYSTIIDLDLSENQMRVCRIVSECCSSSYSETALFYDEPNFEALVYGDSYGTRIRFINQNRVIDLPSASQSDVDTKYVRLFELRKFDGGFDILYKNMSIMSMENKEPVHMTKRIILDRLFSNDDDTSNDSNDSNDSDALESVDIIEFPFLDQGRDRWDGITLPVIDITKKDTVSAFDLRSQAVVVERDGKKVRVIATYDDQNIDRLIVDSKMISTKSFSRLGQLNLIEMIDGIDWTYNIRSFPAKIIDLSTDDDSCTGRILFCFHTFDVYASAENDIMVKIPLHPGFRCAGISPSSQSETSVTFAMDDMPYFGHEVDLARIIDAAKFNSSIVRTIRGTWINGEGIQVNVWPNTMDLDLSEDQNAANEVEARAQENSIDKVFGNYYPKNQLLRVTYEDGVFFKEYHDVSYKCSDFQGSLICLVDEPLHKTDRESYSSKKFKLSPEWADFLKQKEDEADLNDASAKKYLDVVGRIAKTMDRRGMTVETFRNVFNEDIEHLIEKHLLNINSNRNNDVGMKSLLALAEALPFNKVLYVIQDENFKLSQNAAQLLEPTFSEVQFTPTECKVFLTDADEPEIVSLPELIGRPLRTFKLQKSITTLFPPNPIRMHSISESKKYAIIVWGADVNTRSETDQEFLDASDKKMREDHKCESMHIFTKNNIGWIWAEDQHVRCPENQTFKGFHVELPPIMSDRVNSITLINDEYSTKLIMETIEGELKTMPLRFGRHNREIMAQKQIHFKSQYETKDESDDEEFIWWRVESMKCVDKEFQIVFQDSHDAFMDRHDEKPPTFYTCTVDVDELLDEATKYELHKDNRSY